MAENHVVHRVFARSSMDKMSYFASIHDHTTNLPVNMLVKNSSLSVVVRPHLAEAPWVVVVVVVVFVDVVIDADGMNTMTVPPTVVVKSRNPVTVFVNRIWSVSVLPLSASRSVFLNVVIADDTVGETEKQIFGAVIPCL